MTVQEAIERIDDMKPNTTSLTEKVNWLSELDGMIQAEIYKTHELDETTSTEQPISEKARLMASCVYSTTAMSTELKVEAPWDKIYEAWLEMKIDYQNGESLRYNNSLSRFNTFYDDYATHFNRTHMPVGVRFKFW